MNLGRTDHFDEEGAGADGFGAVHLSQELVDLPADTEWGDRGEGPAILQAQQNEAGAVRDVGRVVIGRGGGGGQGHGADAGREVGRQGSGRGSLYEQKPAQPWLEELSNVARRTRSL